MRVGDNLEIVSAQVTLDATGDKLVMPVAAFPRRIVRWGFIVEVECTGDMVARLDHTTHAADGTPTEATSQGGKTLTGAAAKVGSVLYCEPDEEVVVKPGDFATIDIPSNAFTAGDGKAFIQYQQLNWAPGSPNGDFSDATPTTRLQDGSTDV